MTQVVFWGSGNAFTLVYSMFKPDQIEVIGVVDNKEKFDLQFEYISPRDLLKKDFDLLVISSIDYCNEIRDEAIALGINPYKILTPYMGEKGLVRWNSILSDHGIQIASFLKIQNLEKKTARLEKKVQRLERNISIDRTYRPIRELYERKSADELYNSFISKRKVGAPVHIFRGRDDFRKYMARQLVGRNGLLLEFGVFQGNSINTMSNILKDRKFYGFDSFEGLPEEWHDGYEKGKFSLEGKLPKVNDNVELVKGWFDETLPDFLHTHTENIALIHIDCDLYSSANYVLDILKNRIKSGTIIIFDELLGYVDYENNELLALKDYLHTSDFDYEYLASSFVWNENGHYVAVAIEIKER